MDVDTENVLDKVLSKEELEKIPPDIRKKLESHFVEKFEEFITSKALHETATRTIDDIRTDLEKTIAELKLQNEEYSAKIVCSQQSITELRNEMEIARTEITSLHQTVQRYEKETAEYRKERNDAYDERDSLLKMVERRNIEVERLQADVISLENQLQSAINSKCEALSKIDEINSKEQSLDFKEKMMEQERNLLKNTIKTLNEDLNRNMNELATIRRDKTFRTLTLETSLSEKTEELKIANSTIAQLNETNTSLTAKCEELASKLLTHSDDVTKMMDSYKKELIAKTKLAELYKEASDDNKHQIDELSSAITDLKKLLEEATESYGELETQKKSIEMKHEEEIEEKNKHIQELQDELKNANDLLKVSQEENLEHAIENLAPTAAAASRLIKSGMSLTEIYSVYVKTSEELQHEKKENSRLNLQIKAILQELEEKAPLIRKQAVDYQKLYEANTEMTQQLENLIVERVEAKEMYNESIAKLSYFERENKKLKSAQSDLSRQVCFLIKEIEQIRGGFSSEVDQSVSSDMSANEVITKKLVTFTDIQELQENNQKLLLLVRDLSSKLEEMEQGQINIQNEAYQTRLESLNKRIKELQDSQRVQTQMLDTSMQQKERYKKMYYEALKATGKISQSANSSINGDDTAMDEDPPIASSSILNTNDPNKDKNVASLEEKVKDLTAQLKSVKDEYETYRKEKATNDKMLNEQFDTMRNEVRELTSTNCRLMSAAEYSSEQLKILQKNVATYKKQISTLEDRNKNYETTIIKHEQTLMHVKDEAMSAQSKLAHYEVMAENLKQEVRVLRDSEARLKMEREVFNRERHTQNLLLNNLEMIKASFERSETEGRMRMESRLDEMNRECSALRRRLQEEQDRFRELSQHLERQTSTAQQKMEDEKAQAEKLRVELEQVREEIIQKTKQVDEMSRKLQESLTPSLNDNPITQANKKAREFELKYEQSKSDIAELEKELANVKEHLNQYCTMANSSEKELKEMHEKYTNEKKTMEAELTHLRKLEVDMKTRINELETEISLQITGAQLSTGDADTQLHRVQVELKEALEKLSVNNRELRELRTANASLTTSLHNAEQKYANEMVLHSTDIQAMSTLKETLNRVTEEVAGTKADRDKAIETLELSKKSWLEMEERLKKQQIELEERVQNLDAQNTALHDQIQTLSTKLSITASGASGTPAGHDESMDVADSSLVNRSITDEDIKSSDQLLQVIKYLRKEKDIAVAKVDILKNETVRLQSEHAVLQSKLDEAIQALSAERSKSEVGVVTAVKHSELLRKIETLNAITDINRILREERDALAVKVAELTERCTKCEDELQPLQEKNKELMTKADAAAGENASLRIEATRWRQRANLLVERSNKASPEEFKKLQTERENLTKLLASEKENLKKVLEELTSIKTEKARLDQELTTIQRQLTTGADENRKHLEEINTLKQQNIRMTQEIIEMKSTLLNREDELKKVTEDLANRDANLAELKKREIQLRNIAKRYKDSFFGLKKAEGKDGASGEKTEDGQNAGETSIKQEQEKALQEKIDELNTQIAAAQEEATTLRRENETLKSNAERQANNANLVKEAKSRIVLLTESKKSADRELAVAKQTIEQNRSDHEVLLNGIKTQFETRVSRLEAAHAEQDKERTETIARLTRENETLQMRINQLNRQLGLQSGTKPTTSSNTGEKSSTESPRTANVKPMAGPSGQQSATVTPWRGSETPLASIRPMSVQNSRTVAVAPTSQTSNVAAIQGSPSSASVTALVPPQQVHTTASSGEAMSSSPTSSHTDYMPATSSATVVVAAVPPMGSASTSSTSAESSQEAESVPQPNNESSSSSSSAIIAPGGATQSTQQQAVALVSPRVEGAQPNLAPPQSVSQNPEQNQAPSTSGGTSSSTPVTHSSSHQQASSSNTVTTTQAGGHKRPRDVEGDSSTGNTDEAEKQTSSKRARATAGEVFQGVSESGIEVEYQVPTSSQRDQEDDVIVVDSEEDDDDEGMADEGNAEADDGPFEDDGDNGDGYEMEESYEQDQDVVNYDEGEGPDIDEDHMHSDTNEVEVDDSSEVPNQSSSAGIVAAPDVASTSAAVVGQSSASTENVASTVDNQTIQAEETQQIQTISSGSDAGPSTSQSPSAWRGSAQPGTTTQHGRNLMLLQQGFEETGDDSIVPGTPTMYNTAQRRGPDGSFSSSEVVSSPHSQVPHAARFTFSEPRSIPGQSTTTGDEMDETRVDLSELVPTTPQKLETSSTEQTSSTDETVQQQEAVAGPSHGGDGAIPEITITMPSSGDDEKLDENATTSDAAEDEHEEKETGEGDIDEGEGTDGVSSEGEKAPAMEGVEVEEEGREAEATSTPSRTTRSANRGGTTPRRGGRGQTRGGRPAPIVWQDQNRGHGGGGGGQRSMQMNISPSRQQQFQQNQRSRGRRMRRASGPNFGNMRY